MYDSIGVCIDLDARRAIATPPSIEGMRKRFVPTGARGYHTSLRSDLLRFLFFVLF